MPTDTEARLRRACTTLERRLRDGAACRAEDLIAADPALAADPETVLELVYTEYAIREELGGRPDPQDFYDRFPALREALADQLCVHGLVRTASPGDAVPDTPETVDRYEVLEDLSRGRGGRVFRARHRDLGRVVALKLVPGSVRGAGEAWAAAKLEHPNIVRLYDVGAAPGGAFLAMEYAGGGTLADRLGGHPLPAAVAGEVVEAVARAADHAHQRGVVHRDIKPANVLLADPAGAKLQPKLADFGLATAGETGGTEGVVGTPGYMAPEQARGDSDVGPAADVYALGAVLYECLTGRPPFRADTPLHTLELALTSDPIPPGRLNPGVPRDLETVCLTCLHRTPGRRYATAAALADDLARWRAGLPVAARPVGPLERGWKWARRNPAVASLLALLAAAAVAIVGGGAWTNAQLRAARDAAARDADTIRQAYDEARLSVYTTQLAQVNSLYQTDPGRALALLDDPERCPTDLRDFAWGLFRHHCRRDARTFPNVGTVTGLAFSPDGRVLRADRPDGVRAWVVESGEPCEPFISPPAGYDVQTEDTAVVLTERTTGRQTRVSLGFRPAAAVADPVGRRVVTVEGTHPNRLAVRDTATGRLIASVSNPHLLPPHDLAWSPDGAWLASGGADRVVRLWNPADLREVAVLRGHTGNVRRIAFSPDGRHVASAADDLSVRVWPVARPAADPGLCGGNTAKITALAFTPGGAAVVVATYTGEVKRWDRPFTGPPRVLAATGVSLLALAISSTGRVAVGDINGGVRVLDPDGRVLGQLAGHTNSVRAVAWSADGRVLATGGEDQVVRLWADDVSRQLDEWRIAPSTPMGLEFAPDGQTLTVAGRDRVVQWNIQTREVTGEVPGHGDGVLFARVCPGSRTLVSGGLSYEVKLWSLDSADPRHTLAGHSQFVVGAAFTPDGRTLATGSGNRFENVPGEVKLWDVATGHLRATLAGQTGPLAFSPDGWTLATVENHAAVRLWRADRP